MCLCPRWSAWSVWSVSQVVCLVCVVCVPDGLPGLCGLCPCWSVWSVSLLVRVVSVMFACVPDGLGDSLAQFHQPSAGVGSVLSRDYRTARSAAVVGCCPAHAPPPPPVSLGAGSDTRHQSQKYAWLSDTGGSGGSHNVRHRRNTRCTTL